MRILRKKSANNKNLIVLDIGSQFLKAIVLEINEKGEKGVLKSWAKEETVADWKNIYPACKKLIAKVEKKAGTKGKELFLGVNCEMAWGTSTTFCYKRENSSQKIDLTELKYLIQKIQWKAFDKIRKTFALETGLLETEVELINAYVVNIKIDNKSVVNPLGFQGETICLTLFNTYTSSEFLERLKKLASQLKFELVGINSGLFALFNCLDLESLGNDFLIIDIGGKITEIGLIKNRGEIIEMKSFNLGGQVFTEAIAGFLELEKDEAEKIKIKYSKEELGSEVKKKLRKLFNPNLFSWLGGVKVVLDDFSRRYKSMPFKIFLCGGGSKLPDVKQTLKKRDNFQLRPSSSQLIIRIKNRTNLKSIPCLALAELALKSSEETMFSSTLNRVIRLIQE